MAGPGRSSYILKSRRSEPRLTARLARRQAAGLTLAARPACGGRAAKVKPAADAGPTAP